MNKTLAQEIIGLVGEGAEWKAGHYYKDGDDLGSVEQEGGKWVAYSGNTELGKFDDEASAKAAVEKASNEAADDLSPSTKARHDKENMELAKLTVEQLNMIKAMKQSADNLYNQAKQYDAWLKKNKVEAHLSPVCSDLASDMEETLNMVIDIV